MQMDSVDRTGRRQAHQRNDNGPRRWGGGVKKKKMFLKFKTFPQDLPHFKLIEKNNSLSDSYVLSEMVLY